MSTDRGAELHGPQEPGTDVRAGARPPARVAIDDRAVLLRGGTLVSGGAPWALVRLSAAARPFARRLAAAGPAGLVAATATERTTAASLIARGLAHPIVPPRTVAADEMAVVVPVRDRPRSLDACLHALEGHRVIVVDDASLDASAVSRVARAHGAHLVRHEVNTGPGAARNTGLRASDTPLVAFLDSDCVAPQGWLEALVGYFDDERVGAVAPRIRAQAGDGSLLARSEVARSELDMGQRRGLVRHGASVRYLPSAALVVRREALLGRAFDPSMRVGEDVDLVWRLLAAGWHVRFEPGVTVHHGSRLRPTTWARRRLDYGTSAAALERRHPGRLAPAQLAAWNVATALLVGARRPAQAGMVLAVAAGTVVIRLRRAEVPGSFALRLFAAGAVADVAAFGHLLRREWWPLGWGCVLATGRSRTARACATAMVAPLLVEHVHTAPAIDPVRYTLLRLAGDAAYGTGVVLGALRHRRMGVLLPRLRLPFLRRRPGGRSGGGARRVRRPAARPGSAPPR